VGRPPQVEQRESWSRASVSGLPLRRPAPDTWRRFHLPPVGGDSWAAGVLLTRSLLLYPLTAGGSDGGPRLVADDERTGAEVASVDLPGSAFGTPMTYMLDGKQ
jgi:hypothetical protein